MYDKTNMAIAWPTNKPGSQFRKRVIVTSMSEKYPECEEKDPEIS